MVDDEDKMQDQQQDEEVTFDMLDPQDQKMLLDNMMEGKPRTPQNMNKARELLMNDPETVASMCDKLGIDYKNEADDEGDDDGE